MPGADTTSRGAGQPTSGDRHVPRPRVRAEQRTRKKLVSYTPDEFLAVCQRAAACGKTPSRFIREVSLGAVPKARRDAVQLELIRQLARIGNNINQLAREANAASQFPVERRIDAALAQLHAAIDRVG